MAGADFPDKINSIHCGHGGKRNRGPLDAFSWPIEESPFYATPSPPLGLCGAVAPGPATCADISPASGLASEQGFV